MLELVTGPTVEPVTYDEVLHHLRVDPFDEDIDLTSQTYINQLITAVRKACEAFTNRAFVTQTWKQYLDAWPSRDYIEIYKPPLQSITHIKYTDEDATQSTWSTDYYAVDTKSVKGRAVLKPNQSWPTVTLYSVNPIEIQFIAGYTAVGEDIESAIRHAILLQVGDLWDNREDFREDMKLIRASEMLLWPFRVFY